MKAAASPALLGEPAIPRPAERDDVGYGFFLPMRTETECDSGRTQ
jgi:hypothetical protein